VPLSTLLCGSLCCAFALFAFVPFGMAKFLSSTFKSSDLLRSSQIFMGSSGRPQGRCPDSSAADRTFCAWTSISRSDILIAGANQLSSAAALLMIRPLCILGFLWHLWDSPLESTFNAYHSNSVSPHLFVLGAFEGLYSVTIFLRTIRQLSGSMGGGSRAQASLGLC
jgi:hypothetical protein